MKIPKEFIELAVGVSRHLENFIYDKGNEIHEFEDDNKQWIIALMPELLNGAKQPVNTDLRVHVEKKRIEVNIKFINKAPEKYTHDYVFFQFIWNYLKHEFRLEDITTDLQAYNYCIENYPTINKQQILDGFWETMKNVPTEQNHRRYQSLAAHILKPNKKNMSTKFTKMPVTVEAIQFNGNSNKKDIENFVGKELEAQLESETAYVAGAGPPIFSLLIETKEGTMKAFAGDWIIKEPFPTGDRDFYPCKDEIFKKTYFPDQYETPLQQLSKLQEEVGYTKGPVNIVALLGAFGEAGELLAETFLIDNSEDEIKAEDLKIIAVQAAEKIDALKKKVRDNKHPIAVELADGIIDNRENFDKELADQFYYVHALAKNRGLTLDDLAQMSINKINAKRLQKDISHGSGSN